ncbi:MAG: hypothetical protein QXV32_05270 [Conexivisphaerales archaeon]
MRSSGNKIMAKERAAIYGTSSEGYRLALFLYELGDEVSIIDERIKTSYELSGKPPESIRQIIGEDSLYPIQPLSAALEQADKVVMAPRLKHSEEGRGEWLQRLKEVGQNLKQGSTLVNMVPLTLGGNREALTILEEQSGLKAGSDFAYVYSPVGNCGIASHMAAKLPSWVAKMLNRPKWYQSLDEAELQYVRWALSEYMPKALDASFYRDATVPIELSSNLFLDDLAQGIYDMQLFADTLQHGDTLHHMATGSLKALQNYTHTLESYLRIFSRNKGLKAIRSRVLLVWSYDTQEMKAERSRIIVSLLNSLREIFGDVDLWNPTEQASEERKRIPSVEKYQMIVACSKDDLNLCKTSIRRTPDQVVISASIPIQSY